MTIFMKIVPRFLKWKELFKVCIILHSSKCDIKQSNVVITNCLASLCPSQKEFHSEEAYVGTCCLQLYDFSLALRKYVENKFWIDPSKLQNHYFYLLPFLIFLMSFFTLCFILSTPRFLSIGNCLTASKTWCCCGNFICRK